MDPEIVQTVVDWQPQKSIIGVRSFLGMAGYYRHFIKNFSRIAKLLIELTKNDIRFVWTEACQKAFKELKTKLTTSPVLALPDVNKDFTIYYDVSWQGLGCVLMQEGRVIAYASRQLKKHEQN